MATQVADIAGLVEGIPAGAWVAISESENRVVCYGVDLPSVSAEARSLGVRLPLLVRVPEQPMMMFF